MINRVILVGRLTRDPELRYLQDGTAVANFTLAVNRPFSKGDQQADFINIVVWRKQAENAANYLRKGSLAGIDGRLQTRSYENNSGKRVFVTEVVADSVQFLDSRKSQKPNEKDISEKLYGDPFEGDGKKVDVYEIDDEDIPF